MKLRHAFAFLAITAMAACAPQDAEDAYAEPAAEMGADEAAVDQVRADYVTHYNMGHADMVADMFSDSAVFMAADQSIHEGKAAILASLTEDMAGNPVADIGGDATMIFGDMALSRGPYSVTVTPEGGEAMTMTGYWLSGLERTDTGWKIVALITNYDAVPPEGTPMGEMPGEAPPEAGTMADLLTAYVTAFNAGDAAATAQLFTDDAVFAFSNLPVSEGRAAIQAALENRFSMGTPQLELHDVGTWEMAEGWSVDAGWYRLSATGADGEITQTGNYVNLVQQQPDGSWKIHWGISNGVPQAAM